MEIEEAKVLISCFLEQEIGYLVDTIGTDHEYGLVTDEETVGDILNAYYMLRNNNIF